MSPFELTGKHVLVTGASSGIGRATAIACGAMGATVLATGRNAERLSETVAGIPNDGHSSIAADLNDAHDIERIATLTDKLDGIVLCAGTLQTMPARFVGREHLTELFETNVYAAVTLMSALLQAKRINKDASVVVIGSAATECAVESGNAVYSATKAALQAYARVLAKELAPRRIRVNCIAPGMVMTPLLRHFDADDEQLAANEKKYPLGFGRPDDVAYAAVYLLSDAARWMTGSVLRIDGGLSLG